MNDVDPDRGRCAPSVQPPRCMTGPAYRYAAVSITTRHFVADSIVPIFIAALCSQRRRPYWGITHQREQRSESYIAPTFLVEEAL
jgi:hypothetical protein